ncbi:MAG: DEAD/DEAH box helicase, partial [Bacteriovoracaceae bacterium]|nr:DEAD/DEAH box helicase [Bacteriovoracaceae bacterium]
IDVGFLQFNGLKLERRYSSLVHPGKIVVSRFIQKLTGISLAALKKAPAWSTVQDDLADLAEHTIVAYNAGFEQSFLASTLGSAVQYADGLNLLPLCFPGAANFRLETFLAYWQLKPAEAHLGLADAEDMLKVMLTAVYNLRHHYPEQDLFLREKFATYQLAQTWIGKFFHLDDLALVDLAGEIDFTIPELPQAAALLAPSSAGAAIGLEEDSSTPPGAPADDASLGKRRTSSEDLSFSGAFIEKLLRDADLMGRTYPQHQFRQGQVDMARRVGQALKNNVHAMIQAPTGTGKTLAYLLPAMLLATVEGEKVLIATGTKTLQRQILGQEIPRVRQLLGLREEECPVAFMIGSQNHLCPQKLATAQNGRLWPQESEEVRWAFLYLASIIFFNEQLLRHQDVTHQCRLLSRAAISSAWKSKYPVLAQLETELAVDFRYCAGPRCPHAKCCAYQGGIKLARQAALIIGNHALLLAWPRGLERPRKIIIDEAQGMEKDATEAFHWELGQKSLASLVDRLRDKTLL